MVGPRYSVSGKTESRGWGLARRAGVAAAVGVGVAVGVAAGDGAGVEVGAADDVVAGDGVGVAAGEGTSAMGDGEACAVSMPGGFFVVSPAENNGAAKA